MVHIYFIYFPNFINKSAHTKKSGNVFNDPRIYEYIHVYTHTLFIFSFFSLIFYHSDRFHFKLYIQTYILYVGGAFNVTIIIVKMESVTRVQILNEAVCVSHCANVLEKAKNPFFSYLWLK